MAKKRTGRATHAQRDQWEKNRRVLNMLNPTPTIIEVVEKFTYRYNYTEQRWERKTKAMKEWEHDSSRTFPPMNDETFLKEYTDNKTFPSIASLARWFGVSYKSIYHKRLAMNTKIREAYGKPKDFVALAEKDKFTDDEKRRKEEIDNKPATIQDIVSSLPEDVRKAMGLS